MPIFSSQTSIPDTPSVAPKFNVYIVGMPDQSPPPVPFASGDTTGFLHVPVDSRNLGLVLTHGAGANCQAPLLFAVAGAFASAGFHVLRCDLPFRQRRASGPPHPSQAAEDRNGLRSAVAALGDITSGPIVLGGHSYGGRQASMLAAEDPALAAALLLLSYPLHPPNKPAQPRTAHFPQLQTQTLFVHGTKDPFASAEELRAAIRLIPATAELAIIEGAAHDLKRGKFDIVGTIVGPVLKRASVEVVDRKHSASHGQNR